MISEIGPLGAQSGATAPEARLGQLREKAQELEAAFLSEMLGHAGLGTPMSEFGGGHGEEHFSSFLRKAHVDALVGRGGIGLAEHLFNAMKVRLDDAP
jgi:Rod binding domain-containing protein